MSSWNITSFILSQPQHPGGRETSTQRLSPAASRPSKGEELIYSRHDKKYSTQQQSVTHSRQMHSDFCLQLSYTLLVKIFRAVTF